LAGGVVARAIDIALDGRERRNVLGQGAPWAGRPAQVQDGVGDHPQPPLPRPASPLWRRQPRRDLRPSPGPHLACVGQLVAPILRAGDFSPHVVAPALSAYNTESQLTEITQLISQSGSQDEDVCDGINKNHPDEDEGEYLMALRNNLILRSRRSRRLEGRKALM